MNEDSPDKYMVTGFRNGYRVPIIRDLSYIDAHDLKTRLNCNNAYVGARVQTQGKVVSNENMDIDEITRKWAEER